MTDFHQFKNLKIDYEDNIAIVQLNQENSKVNTLSQGMMNEFVPVFNHLKNDENIKGIVVISTKPGSFIAGADTNMLESIKSRDELYKMSRYGQEMMDEIEQSSKPIIAAIAGSCLGGGLEIALACHYRMVLNDKRTRFGVPEVKLGLLPGAGGTQRLLRKLLLTDALDLLLTGREINAKKAKELGLVNVLVGTGSKDIEYLRSIAVQKAKELIICQPSPPSSGLLESKLSLLSFHDIKSQIMSNSYVRNYILSQAQVKVLSQTQGLYPAPLRILDVIRQTLEKGSTVGFNAEAEAFADLGMTNESKALISLLHGRTECKKNKYGKSEREFKTIAVIGSGVIGAGIAHISIDKDFQVILYDRTFHALARGQTQIEKGYRNYIKRNRITKTEYNHILSNLNYQTTFDHFEQCDLVIEATFEDLNLKQKILQQLEEHIPEHCILASNTCLLSIDQIATNTRRPDKVIGMHYLSPVEKIELLEIIRTEQTSEATLCSVINVGLKQGKIIIVVNDGPGFYTTRLLIFSCVEVFYLLQEGLSPIDIDKATKKFGFHVGLATLIDEFGIDMIVYIAFHLQKIFGERLANTSVMEVLEIFVNNNLFGRKSGQGLFIYRDGGKKEVNGKLKELIGKSLIQVKEISTTETIQWRVSLRILNEAARCLEENILHSPTDGDIGAVFGLGFPPMKGGPFRFMDTYGISNIVDLLKNYQLKYGDRFTPTQLLIDMEKENKTFYSSN